MTKQLASESRRANEQQKVRKKGGEAPPKAAAVAPVEYAFNNEFNEAEYLRRHPEVAEAIAEGHLPNALFHFRVFSTKPRRNTETARREPATQQNGAEPSPQVEILPSEGAARTARAEPTQPHGTAHAGRSFGPGSLDAVVCSPSGALFVIGWAADREAPLHRIAVHFDDGRAREWPAANLIRFRRIDAEKALGLEPRRRLGFCGLLSSEGKANGAAAKPRAVTLSTADEASAEFSVTPRLVGDVELREVMLGYLAGVEFLGNKHVESFYALDDHLGQALIRHSQTITRSIVDAVTVERFETAADRFKATVIVCLYGKAEFQFIQNALFAASAGCTDYEYI